MHSIIGLFTASFIHALVNFSMHAFIHSSFPQDAQLKKVYSLGFFVNNQVLGFIGSSLFCFVLFLALFFLFVFFLSLFLFVFSCCCIFCCFVFYDYFRTVVLSPLLLPSQ